VYRQESETITLLYAAAAPPPLLLLSSISLSLSLLNF